jgi:hypothetical protein
MNELLETVELERVDRYVGSAGTVVAMAAPVVVVLALIVRLSHAVRGVFAVNLFSCNERD